MRHIDSVEYNFARRMTGIIYSVPSEDTSYQKEIITSKRPQTVLLRKFATFKSHMLNIIGSEDSGVMRKSVVSVCVKWDREKGIKLKAKLRTNGWGGVTTVETDFMETNSILLEMESDIYALICEVDTFITNLEQY